jgi:hypothetical protein
MATLPIHTNSTSVTPWTLLPSRIRQNLSVIPIPRPCAITRTRSIDLLNLVTGIIIGVVGTIVATRLAQQSLEVSREALELGKWTAMKDWMENCQVEVSQLGLTSELLKYYDADRVIQEPECKAALAKGLPPPPFLSEASATDLPITPTSLHPEPFSLDSATTGPPTTTTEIFGYSSLALSTTLPPGSRLTGSGSISYNNNLATLDKDKASLVISASIILPTGTITASQWPAPQTILPAGTITTASQRRAPLTILPIRTITAASQWFPPIATVVQSDTPNKPPDSPSMQTGIPLSLPKAITRDDGVTYQPRKTTMIQIGFNYKLPYPFIVANSVAVAQIFALLPTAIAYGLDIPEDEVVVHKLVPYDTTKELSYITTVAICFIATDLVDQLVLDLLTPHSKLFQNPLSSVSSLVDLINISFPILEGEGQVLSPSGGQAEAISQLSLDSKAGTVFGAQNLGPNFDKVTTIVSSLVFPIFVYAATMVAISRRYRVQKSHRKSYAHQ